MTEKYKKIIKITAIVLGVFFTGLLIYYIFFKPETPAGTPETDKETPPVLGELVPETRERLVAITEETVLGAEKTEAGKIIYVAWDGSINETDLNGQNTQKIGSFGSEKISQIIISKNGNLVASRQTLPSGQNKFLVFDIAKKNLKSLPQNTDSLAFSPNGSEIVTSLKEKNSSKITISLEDGSEAKTVALVRIPDLILEWNLEKSIELKTKPSGLAYGLFYSLDLNSKKTERVLGNVFGLTSLASPSGKRILYSQTESDGRNLKIKVLDKDKKTESILNIFSLPEKCAWSQDNRTVFCGHMKTEDDSVMPDDYYKRLLRQEDEDMVRINIETGQTQTLVSGPFDSYKPFLFENESFLFFINKKDGRLYRLAF